MYRNLGHKGLIGDTPRARGAFTTCHHVAMHSQTLIPFALLASEVDKYFIMTRRTEFEVSQSGITCGSTLIVTLVFQNSEVEYASINREDELNNNNIDLFYRKKLFSF